MAAKLVKAVDVPPPSISPEKIQQKLNEAGAEGHRLVKMVQMGTSFNKAVFQKSDSNYEFLVIQTEDMYRNPQNFQETCSKRVSEGWDMVEVIQILPLRIKNLVVFQRTDQISPIENAMVALELRVAKLEGSQSDGKAKR